MKAIAQGVLIVESELLMLDTITGVLHIDVWEPLDSKLGFVDEFLQLVFKSD